MQATGPRSHTGGLLPLSPGVCDAFLHVDIQLTSFTLAKFKSLL